MLGNASTLTVELVVLGADKLLGALGAVVAGGAGGADGCRTLGAQGHARGGAGEHALGEHFGGWWSGDEGQLVLRDVVRVELVELTKRCLALAACQATRKMPAACRMFALFAHQGNVTS